MAIWPFNRRKQSDDYADGMQEELPMAPEQQQPTSNLPEEVQEYYESGKRERVGVAWLLGLGTLIATVLLAMVLFFGGRWIYRTIAGTNEPESTAQIGEEEKKKQEEQSQQNTGNQNQGQTQPDTQQPSQPAPTPTPAPTPAPSNPQPTPAPTPAPSPAPAPTTGGKTPNTGPGDVAAVAGIATAVVATAGAYVVQLRRQN